MMPYAHLKIQRPPAFYLAVYPYLQQHIRNDILHTDNPRLAIEEMAIELARLTEELTVRESKLTISLNDNHALRLDTLGVKREEDQDLFVHRQLSLSEMLAKLYQRFILQFDSSHLPSQLIEGSLLNYRNYLQLTVEVCQGNAGWLHVKSSILSTGKAIGTGMAIFDGCTELEIRNRYAYVQKMFPPVVYYFLTKLHGYSRSINTLFELCSRL